MYDIKSLYFIKINCKQIPLMIKSNTVVPISRYANIELQTC